MVTTKVKAKLFDENMIRGASISVETFGGYVTLTGAVENEKKREHAAAIVKSVYGMGKVNNLLMIKE